MLGVMSHRSRHMETGVVSCGPRPLAGRVPAANGNLAYTSAKGRNSILKAKLESGTSDFSIHVSQSMFVYVTQSTFLNPDAFYTCLNSHHPTSVKSPYGLVALPPVGLRRVALLRLSFAGPDAE